jgi:hypothetical protein
MGEPFNRGGQVFPANQPGVGTQYDPKPVPETVATAPAAVTHAPAPAVGPAVYADGTPASTAPAVSAPTHAPTPPVSPTGATGESFLQHLEDEIKAHI